MDTCTKFPYVDRNIHVRVYQDVGRCVLRSAQVPKMERVSRDDVRVTWRIGGGRVGTREIGGGGRGKKVEMILIIQGSTLLSVLSRAVVGIAAPVGRVLRRGCQVISHV